MITKTCTDYCFNVNTGHTFRREYKVINISYDYVNTNIVENSVKNNTKSFDRIQCNTAQYRNSFFNKSILEWNHLEENIVSATSVESFKSALRHHQ
jgi:hypothetical protein